MVKRVRRRNRNDLEILLGERLPAFIEEFQGQRIWISMPSEMRPFPGGRPTNQGFVDLLVRTVGSEATERLRAVFGGDWLNVPILDGSAQELKRKIAAMHKEGHSINDIVKACNVSRRTVFRRLNEKITERI